MKESTAQDLCLSGIDTVTKIINGSYSGHICGSSMNNFNLIGGNKYIIHIVQNTSMFHISGTKCDKQCSISDSDYYKTIPQSQYCDCPNDLIWNSNIGCQKPVVTNCTTNLDCPCNQECNGNICEPKEQLTVMPPLCAENEVLISQKDERGCNIGSICLPSGDVCCKETVVYPDAIPSYSIKKGTECYVPYGMKGVSKQIVDSSFCSVPTTCTNGQTRSCMLECFNAPCPKGNQTCNDGEWGTCVGKSTISVVCCENDGTFNWSTSDKCQKVIATASCEPSDKTDYTKIIVIVSLIAMVGYVIIGGKK
jgi:hypothetical protein